MTTPATFELHFTFKEHALKANPLKDKALKEEVTSTALNELHQQLKNTENPLTKAELKLAVSKGALWLTRGKHTQRLRRVKKILQLGDELHFYYNAAVLATQVEPAQLIADMKEYSVWYKPYGMLSQGSKWSDHCTIARFVQQTLTPERPVFIVHRLDRAATGLILLAHSKKAARAFSALFERQSITESQLEKHYHIIVHGNHTLRPQPEVITTDVDGKKAKSTFTCLEYNEKNKQSLIQVKIDSGRKHQIRIHAASIGLPVVGDRLYGDRAKDETKDKILAKDLQLCAASLRFYCPLTSDNEKTHQSHQQAMMHFQLPKNLLPQL